MIDLTNLPAQDKIYYQDDAVVIYCADNRDILPLFPDKSFDLVLTDPPYNGGLDYGDTTNDKRDWRDYSEWLNEILIQSERACGGAVLSFLS